MNGGQSLPAHTTTAKYFVTLNPYSTFLRDHPNTPSPTGQAKRYEERTERLAEKSPRDGRRSWRRFGNNNGVGRKEKKRKKDVETPPALGACQYISEFALVRHLDLSPRAGWTPKRHGQSGPTAYTHRVLPPIHNESCRLVPRRRKGCEEARQG